MNIALTPSRGQVRPRVFRYIKGTGMDQWAAALIITGCVGGALCTLLLYDGPLWPNRVWSLFKSAVPTMVMFAFMMPYVLMGRHLIPRPGHLLLFPDHVGVGLMSSSVEIPRAAIVSVERWNGPLFDLPWQAANARLHREGFAHNETLGRFHYYVTRESNAVVIRWTGGTQLVVTPDDPDGFIEALRPGDAMQPR